MLRVRDSATMVRQVAISGVPAAIATCFLIMSPSAYESVYEIPSSIIDDHPSCIERRRDGVSVGLELIQRGEYNGVR